MTLDYDSGLLVGQTNDVPDARIESWDTSGAQLRLSNVRGTGSSRRVADFTVNADGELDVSPSGLLTTFDGNVTLSHTIPILVFDDTDSTTSQATIKMQGTSGINWEFGVVGGSVRNYTTGSHYLNIDSDGNSTGEVFRVSANATFTSGADILFEVGEDGNSLFNTDLTITNTTDQLILAYDGSNETTLHTDSGGDFAISPSGGDVQTIGNLVVWDSTVTDRFRLTVSGGINFFQIGQNSSDTTAQLRICRTLSAATPIDIFRAYADDTIFETNMDIVASSGAQLTLTNNGSVETSLTTDSSGEFTITPSGDRAIVSKNLVVPTGKYVGFRTDDDDSFGYWMGYISGNNGYINISNDNSTRRSWAFTTSSTPDDSPSGTITQGAYVTPLNQRVGVGTSTSNNYMQLSGTILDMGSADDFRVTCNGTEYFFIDQGNGNLRMVNSNTSVNLFLAGGRGTLSHNASQGITALQGSASKRIGIQPGGDSDPDYSMYWPEDGMTYLGNRSNLAGGTLDNGIIFNDNGGDVAPGTNTAGLYAKDVSGTVEMFAVDEANNSTQLSSHNEHGEYYVYSHNISTERTIHIDLEHMAQFLDDQFGTNFFHENKPLVSSTYHEDNFRLSKTIIPREGATVGEEDAPFDQVHATEFRQTGAQGEETAVATAEKLISSLKPVTRADGTQGFEGNVDLGAVLAAVVTVLQNK
jgi:hypothetical protein